MSTRYWLLVAFALLLSGLMLFLRERRSGLKWLPVLPVVVLAVVLSKVGYVVLQWHFAFPRYGWSAFWQTKPTSFCFVTGALGAVLGMVISAKLTHQGVWKALDAFAPCGALLVALLRLGEGDLGLLGTAGFEMPPALAFFPFAITDEWGMSYPAIFMISCVLAVPVALVGFGWRKSARDGTLFLHTAFYLALPQILCESLLAECMKWGFVRVQQLLCALVLLAVMVAFCRRSPKGRFFQTWWPVMGLFLCAAGVVGVEFALDKSGLPMYVGYGGMMLLLALIALCECAAARHARKSVAA